MHNGLDRDGFIAREGSLSLIAPAFAPVVDAARTAIQSAFGAASQSAYLYGSVPRGTAVPGVSDLDVMLALLDEPSDAHRATVRQLEDALAARCPQISAAGIGLVSTATLLSDLERFDLGFMVACLCTPLLGEDLAARLPRYRPTSLLARETNGDLGDLLPQWRDQLSDGETGTLSRRVGRRLVRTGFTLVMPRWGGWTSDLGESVAVFGGYYPDHLEQMRAAGAVARTPTTDKSLLAMLIDDLGSWLAAEYVAVHGPKTPRNNPGSASSTALSTTCSQPVVEPLQFAYEHSPRRSGPE